MLGVQRRQGMGRGEDQGWGGDQVTRDRVASWGRVWAIGRRGRQHDKGGLEGEGGAMGLQGGGRQGNKAARAATVRGGGRWGWGWGRAGRAGWGGASGRERGEK